MTTAQAAAELKVTVRRIQALIKSGALKATKEGRDWSITKAALEAVRERKAGRPRKDKETS